MLASASLSSLRAAAAAPLRVQAASMTLRRWLSAYGKGQPVAMPALSPTMTSGKIARWTVKEGDKLTAGQAIAEIETDKATMDFQFQDDDMIMAKILVPAGSDIAVGTTVALVVDNAADLAEVMGGTYAAGAAAAPAPAAAKPAAAPAPARAASVGSAALAPAPASAAGGRLTSSPYARKLAAAAGIHLAAIGAGSGPNGRIVASDVQGYKAPAAATVAAAAPASVSSIEGLSARSGYTDVPQSSIRRVIAHRLTQSKQTVPHYYLTSELCLDALVVMRSQLNADLPAEAKLSVNDFLIKASALACKKVPEVNSAWLGDVIRAYDYVDVAVAVAIPDGLITPIVKDANAKGLTAISKDVKSLVEKARAKKLAPEEYQGGTFTISNLGMFGVRTFAAIINPPQAAILAVGAAEKRVVPDTTPGAASPFKPSLIMAVTLSCDHRVVDGAVGATWLAAFKGFIEDPKTMLL